MPRLTRTARTSPRAVTLLEVAVVAAVASVIFLMLIRWLLTLAAIDSTTLATAQASRVTNYVDARLSADLASATGCATYTAAPLWELTATTLRVFTVGGRTDGTTGMQLVTWHLDTSTGQLTRWAAPITDTAGCTNPPAAPAVSARPVMASAVTIPAAAGGRAFTAAGGLGDCTSGGGGPTSQACRAGAVTAAFTVTAPGPETGRSVLNRTYTLEGVS